MFAHRRNNTKNKEKGKLQLKLKKNNVKNKKNLKEKKQITHKNQKKNC